MFRKLSISSRLLLGLLLPIIICLILNVVHILPWISTLILIPIALFWYGMTHFLFLKRMTFIAGRLRDTTQGEADLTQRLPVINGDEIGGFSRDFNIFIAQLHNIVFELKNVSGESEIIGDQLAQKTEDISHSIETVVKQMILLKNNSQLLDDKVFSAKGAINGINSSIQVVVDNIDDQSTSVEESSAAVEELISSINNISNISSSKAESVNSLLKVVKIGEDNMSATVDSIKSISSSAGVISELIQVINSVAGQTNILAMNAAIEAAHAGEFGKGFGVVADEIRKLAEATTNNAQDIAKNLNEIIDNIHEAAELTEKTDKSIQKMTEGIGDVADSMTEITSSMSEMSAGTMEMTTALSSLVSITAEVKNSSNQIVEQSGTIDSSMDEITGLSSQNNISIGEINNEIEQINERIELVQDLGRDNVSNLGIIEKDIKRFRIIDTSEMKSSDNQPLIKWNIKEKEIPPRPDNPGQYPEDDERHWYDFEYSGWNVQKIKPIPSPADGTTGKRIICLQPGDHPHFKGHARGMKQMTDALGMELEILTGDWTAELQAKQVDIARKEKPDMIVLIPADAEASTKWLKQLHRDRIPVITSNSAPTEEGFQYTLGHTGVDNWGSHRMLAKKMAETMNYEGGFCIALRNAKSSMDISRTWAVKTELKKIAPKIECLEVMETGLEENDNRNSAIKWIEKYGSKLKAIQCIDATVPLAGMVKAMEEKNREDILVFGSGQNSFNIDYLKKGKIPCVIWESAESEGALTVQIAVDWFNGLDVRPLRYLENKLITTDIADQYYPTQW
ncbi:MAG: substrate-binding domain-containing protein [Spirochaetaceae bacterium]|nr:substrate-binding domain-containing protein [Spirochaetaceae bacterium]